MTKNIKELGQVFTPHHIVKEMLDLCGYKYGKKILRKHIIDNSCGDGAFLCEVVDRYCSSYINWNDTTEWLKSELETFIHGIDIDENHVNQCIANLNKICEKYEVKNVKWDIFVGDSLIENRFYKKMDYVVGNPPYVRTHNLADAYDKVKTYNVSQLGMVDMYVSFFELGINMLNKYGKLCYITPSSWTSSKAGRELRKWFKEEKLLHSIVDMEHYNVFENYSVYTMITLLDRNHLKDTFKYNIFEGNNPTFVGELNINDVDINGEFYFVSPDELQTLRFIKEDKSDKKFFVKNGIATLLDKVFINNDLPFEVHTTNMLKASTGTWSKCFFPYDINGEPINPDVIYENDDIISYLMPYKEELLKRKSDNNIPDWFYYGRTQGLKDTNKERLAINSIIKDVESIKFNIVPEGDCVYSGLYIYSDLYDINIAKKILKTNDFIKYVKSLKKYKSGGFYTFSSKDVEAYLNYKFIMYGN